MTSYLALWIGPVALAFVFYSILRVMKRKNIKKTYIQSARNTRISLLCLLYTIIKTY